MRLQRAFLAFSVVLLSACASGGGSNNTGYGGGSSGGGGGVGSGGNGGGGSAGTVTPPVITPSIDSAAAPATKGSNTTPDLWATSGGPVIAAAPAGTAFPLRQSALIDRMQGNTVTSMAPAPATNSAGATLTVVNSSTMRLTVPALKYDSEFTVPGGYFGAQDGRFSAFSGENLQFVRWGMWGIEDDEPHTWAEARYITGYQSPVAAMPSSGTAIYAGTTNATLRALRDDHTVYGQLEGKASLNVDFSTGLVTGALTNMIAYAANFPNSNWNDVTLRASIVDGNGILGDAVASTAPATPLAITSGASGSVSGGFYGPAADELGAVWSVGDGKTIAMGALGATRQ